jgi:hypothetical protein
MKLYAPFRRNNNKNIITNIRTSILKLSAFDAIPLVAGKLD